VSQAPLEHVLWLGGSPCSGKSTATDALAARHGLQVYHCDAEFERHAREANEREHPTFRRIGAMTPEEIFLRPLAEMVRDAIELCREEFGMIEADLAALPHWPPVVAEGTALLPECVAALPHRPARAAWMVPTEPFQREHYARRPWAVALVGGLSDPSRAFDLWMGRDAAVARHVSRRATALGFEALEVDGTLTLEDSLAWVERRLGLSGP